MPASSRLTKASRRLRRRPRRVGERNQPRERVTAPTGLTIAVRVCKSATRYALVVTAVWLVTTGSYFAFDNDVVTRLIGEQTKLQTTYEDRIAELRAQIDRIMHQKRLDQEQVEHRVNVLLQQQARMSLSLDAVEQKQVTTLTDLGERIDMRTRRMQSVLDDLGIDVGRVSAEGATGGPFIPAKPTLQDSAFEAQLHRVNVGRAQMNRYSQTLTAIPVRKPVIGETEMTSPFGMRKHPILKRRSIHTGIDLRGDIGEPVAAPANGKVTIARRQGGYGNMVEISHGNELATRFAHLSQISVKVGQLVHIGDTVGKIGSTGLSTGPHLHYETRVKGEAVDPQRFLHAGSNLGDN